MPSQEWPRYQYALEKFLMTSEGKLTPATSSRVAKAREKLKKLTKIQFSDLSTDVYDEMQRREHISADPSNPNLPKYLASQPNYHPKRNQARQKLAALPPSRFKDLVNDVLFEIGNRMARGETHIEKERDSLHSKKEQKVTVPTSVPVPVPVPAASNSTSASPAPPHSTSRIHTHSTSTDATPHQKSNLTIDVDKTKQFNDDFFSDMRTPQTSDFVSKTPTSATASQREIKPTTLVPKKSELTWSSDEDDDDENDNHNFTNGGIQHPTKYNEVDSENKTIDHDAIHRSPSKRDTVATNEVLNAHALPHVEFPVDHEASNEAETTDENIVNLDRNLISNGPNHIELKNQLKELQIKIDELELENSQLDSLRTDHRTLKSEYDNLKTEIDNLSRKHDASTQVVNDLTVKYGDYDQLKEELEELKENYNAQLEELNGLKEIANKDQEKQLSVEDSREFDTLKTYLDKVLEENEELKSKLAANPPTSNDRSINEADNTKNLELMKELEHLKKKYDDLLKSYDILNGDYKSLQVHATEISKKYEKQATDLESMTLSLNKSVNSANKSTSTTIQANTAAVKDWQDKFEALRSNQLKSNLTSLSILPKFNDEKLFSPDGYVSIENVSNANASLETILIYLDSKDESSKSLIDPSLLFQRVATFIGHANTISKEITIPSNDRNYVRIEEKKRILKNAISNALSTTKHFALYRNILPQLVLNASLNDVYFSLCSLISLAKIHGDGSKDIADVTQEAGLLEDTATITTTPLALRKIKNIENESPTVDANIANTTANTTANETTVRPLRITQRLASHSALDVNEFAKPTQTEASRSSSPISRKMFGSPILPIIATTNTKLQNDSLNSPKLSSNFNKGRSVNKLGSVENLKDLVNTNTNANASTNIVSDSDADVSLDLGKSDLSILSEGDSVSDDNKKPTPNSEKISVSNLASKFSSVSDSSNKVASGNVKSNSSSPSRGKNISDKLKKFDSVEDVNSSANSSKISLNSSKVKVSNGVAKAFDKFGAKRRADPYEVANNSTNSNNSNSSKENRIDSVETFTAKESSKDNGHVLSDKDINTVNDNSKHDNPFLDGPAEVKKMHAAKNINDKQKPTYTSKYAGKTDDIVQVEDINVNDKSIETENHNTDDIPSESNNYSKDVTSVLSNGKSKSVPSSSQSTDVATDVASMSGSTDTSVRGASSTDGEVTSKVTLNPVASKVASKNNFENNSVETFEGDRYYNAPDTNSSHFKSSALSKETVMSEESLPELKPPVSSTNKSLPTPLDLTGVNSTHATTATAPTEPLSFVKGNDEDDFNNYNGPDQSTISYDPLPSAGSALDIDEQLVRRVSRRQSYRKSVEPTAKTASLKKENKDTLREGWDYNGESEEDEAEDFDVDKFNTLNPDNTLRELLLYLEHQTVEVIGAIQKTLQSIRDPKATKGLLRKGTDEINKVVQQMAEGTSTLMNQSRYIESMGHAKYVVGVLEDCVNRMETLYGSDRSHDNEYAGKNFKQRSAGIAFDVARSTKELVKTVEEASLRDEIAVLDSRLRQD